MKRNYLQFAKQLMDGSWGRDVDDTNAATHDEMQTACLMLIARELQRLNDLLRCPDFQDMPKSLKRIEANTSRRKKPRLHKSA